MKTFMATSLSFAVASRKNEAKRGKEGRAGRGGEVR